MPELFVRVTEEAAAEGTTADEIANEAIKRCAPSAAPGVTPGRGSLCPLRSRFLTKTDCRTGVECSEHLRENW